MPRPKQLLVELVDDDTLIETANESSDDSMMTTSSSCENLSDQDDDNYNNKSVRNGYTSTTSSTPSSEQFRFRVKSVKRVIKTLMRRHGGSTRHPRVTKMIQKLETLNPTEKPGKSSLLLGDFISHTSPDFPGRLRRRSCRGNGDDADDDNVVDDDNIVQYTLGRLSFGIFQPHNLVCTVRAVRNSIQVCDDSRLLAECGPGYSSHDDDLQTFYYPIIIDLTIHAPKGDLHAEMRHEALCYEIPRNDKRLGVTFLGGCLLPAYSVRSDPELLALWKETFANAYKIADEERSYLGRLLRFVVKWALQLSTPTDEDAEKCEAHSVRYEMKRRPKGHLDVLYLDEELRVTRGNRGTLIVVERLPYSTSESSSPTPRNQDRTTSPLQEETLAINENASANHEI